MYSRDDLQIVISHGQSLSKGADGRDPVSTTPLFPGRVLGLGTSSSGNPTLVDLFARDSEVPIVSMLNTVATHFAQAGALAPTLVGAVTGESGRPLLPLYLSSSDRHGDVAGGLAATADGAFYYVRNAVGGSFDIYLNDHGAARLALSTLYEPNLFDPIESSLRKIKISADQAGLNITDKLVFSFIQGQSDSGNRAGVTYSTQLQMLVAKVDAVAESILAKPIETVSIIGQTRYPYPANEQFKFVATTSASYLGALEFPYQAEHPSSVQWRTGTITGPDRTHLNALGYNLLGQETGDVIYDVLTGRGNEDDFIRISDVTVSGARIIVRFSGLDGHLVRDDAIFTTAASGPPPPPNLGFSLSGNSGFTLVGAEITGTDEVTLTANRPISVELRLVLGTASAFGGTPLRDSVARQADNPFGVANLADAEIRKFAPAQSVALPVIVGGAGNDALVGKDGAEVLIGNLGNDTLSGMGGADVIYGGIGNDLIHGGDGNDTLYGGAGLNTLYGDDGDDLFVIVGPSAQADRMFGGSGFDTLRFEPPGGILTIDGLAPSGIEHLVTGGTAIQGRSSANVIDLSEFVMVTGPVIIRGLAGNDRITGTLVGDEIDGGSGTDQLSGGEGDDVFVIRNAEASSDLISGGGGTDTIRVAADSSTVTLARLTVDAEVFEGAGQKINGTSLANLLDFSTFSAVSGIRSISGLAGNDTLIGSLADDAIDGGIGNDTVTGGGGDDTITGGAGNDLLGGGSGADVFVFDQAPSRTRNYDVISDFETGQDRLMFNTAIFAALSPAADALIDASQFRLGAAAGDADDRLIYNQASGDLFYDADGVGVIAQIQFARLIGAPGLEASDILVA